MRRGGGSPSRASTAVLAALAAHCTKGLPEHDVATCGTGAGAGAGAAGFAAAVGACAVTDWGASATSGGALNIVLASPRGASSTVVTTVRTCVSLERACPGEDEAIVTDDRCERTAPMIATSRTIASAHAIAPRRMPKSPSLRALLMPLGGAASRASAALLTKPYVSHDTGLFPNLSLIPVSGRPELKASAAWPREERVRQTAHRYCR